MTRTGSLINELMENASQSLQPEVGMGATLVSWSDRHAGTIASVSRTGHQILWQRDRAIRMDERGMTDAQEYRYERDANAAFETFTRRRDGTYRVKGGTSRLLLGVRDEHYDYSF